MNHGFADGNARGFSDVPHELARNTRQQTRVERRCERRARFHDEEIRERAFGQFAAVVAHQHFVRAALVPFLHGECAVHQVIGLDHRIDGVRMIAHDRRDDHAHAVRIQLRGRVLVRLDDQDHRGDRRGRGVVRQLADAARDEHANVPLGVGRHGPRGMLDGFSNAIGHLIVAERHAECDHGGRVVQPPHMALQQKRFAVIRAQRFIHALAVQKSMIEHRHDRLPLVGDCSVHVDRRRHSLSSTIDIRPTTNN